VVGRGWHRDAVVEAVCVAVAAVAVVAAVAGRAAAQPDGSTRSKRGGLGPNDQIVLNGRLVVGPNETVDSAAILNGPATIDGTVRRGLFVLNGDADISGTVGQDVVVVSGNVTVRSTAHVGGDIVSDSTPTIERGAIVEGNHRSVATRFDFEGFGFATRIIWWIGYGASTLFLGLLLLLLFPAFDGAAVRVWRSRPGEAVGYGAAAFFVLPIAAAIFLLTVVGAPLGLFMLLALALIYTVGYVAGALVLGRLLVKPPSSRFLAFLAGWVILRLVGLVPVLGGFAWLIASLIGLGVLAVAARRTGSAAAPPPVPPLPPAPVPASA
jgi:cytoskeletal protein CcmA (bactofilin family)